MSRYQRIGHVALRVASLENTLSFYVDKLGMRKAGCERNDNGDIWIQYVEITPDDYLELFPEADMKPFEHQYLHHICIEVDDISALAQSLSASGIEMYGNPWKLAAKECPIQEPERTSSGAYSIWVEDPDGNAIEIMQMTDECRRLRSM